MIKTVTLSGAEVRVTGLGGQNAIVKNLSSEAVFASASEGVEQGADGVAEIPSGGGEVLLDVNGTVYLKGTGSVQVTGTNYAALNFKQPSSGTSGGGVNGYPMPFKTGGLYIFDYRMREGNIWTNQIQGYDDIPITEGTILQDGISTDFSLAIPGTIDTFTMYMIACCTPDFNSNNWNSVFANIGDTPQFNLCSCSKKWGIGAGSSDGIYQSTISVSTPAITILRKKGSLGEFFVNGSKLHSYSGYHSEISGYWERSNTYFKTKFIGVFNAYHSDLEAAQNVAFLNERFGVY